MRLGLVGLGRLFSTLAHAHRLEIVVSEIVDRLFADLHAHAFRGGAFVGLFVLFALGLAFGFEALELALDVFGALVVVGPPPSARIGGSLPEAISPAAIGVGAVVFAVVR